MWRPLKINNHQYFISLELKASCQIITTLTDLISVWKEILSKQDVINRFKKCNSKAVLSEEMIIEFIKELFECDEGFSEVNLTEEASCLKLTISKTLIIKMAFHFFLLKQDENSVYNEILVPSLLALNELKQARETLYRQLEAKDVELKEFELEGFKITRKNVITSKFKREEYERDAKNGLEDRIKLGLDCIPEIFAEGVNEIFPALKKVTQSLSTANLKTDDNEARNGEKSENAVKTNTKILPSKRENKNDGMLFCKRLKSSKKIIL